LHRYGLPVPDREDVNDPKEIVTGFGEGVPPLNNLDQLACLPQVSQTASGGGLFHAPSQIWKISSGEYSHLTASKMALPE
jgi:hypothetical protein